MREIDQTRAILSEKLMQKWAPRIMSDAQSEALVERFYGTSISKLLKEDFEMAKKQAKKATSKRIVAKRGNKKWTVSVAKRGPRGPKGATGATGPTGAANIGVRGIDFDYGTQVNEAGKEIVAAPTWLLYHQLEEAGLYAMKNEELQFVRIYQVDSGVGVSMQVHLESTKQVIHPAIVSTAVFQKIKE